MRSCASRGARSPGSARNSSSCSRSDPGAMARRTWCARRQRRGCAGIGQREGGVALGGKHLRRRRIGGRRLGAEFDPGLQVFEPIDDAAAELGIARAGAVGAVLFERAAREAEEARGFWRAQVARRELGDCGGHADLRDARDGRRVSAAVGDHGGEAAPRRGMVKMGGAEFATPARGATASTSVAAAGSKQAAVAAPHQGCRDQGTCAAAVPGTCRAPVWREP